MHHDWILYALAVPAVLITGISKGGFGGGLGVLAVPLMSMAVPPVQAAGILLPILCLMDIFSIASYWKKWDTPNLRILLPAAFLGIAAGTLFFRFLPDRAIRVMVGAVAVLFSIHFFRRRTGIKQGLSRIKGSLWGFVAGFTSFGVHAGGPPVSIHLLPQRLHQTVYVGTTVFFFTAVNYVKLIPYAFLGQLHTGNLMTSLMLAPLAPLGVFLGVRLHSRVGETWFYRICYGLLFLAGVKLLREGIRG